MPVTAEMLANIANSTIDFHMRGPAQSAVLQDRPLLRVLKSRQKAFPGGKEFITEAVKGEYDTRYEGYSYDDSVSYGNPSNTKRTQVKWYEHHAGIAVTMTELKNDGISVVDSMDSARIKEHSGRDAVVLTDIFKEKLDDMSEGSARSMAEIVWRDGTQDPKVMPGILSFILDSPAVGTTFGLDRAGLSWFRNRANVAINAATASNQNLVKTLQSEMRQLRRYGKGPTHMFAGSDFLTAYENELREKGTYTLDGWSKKGAMDGSMADLMFKGIPLEYDPLLDDLGRSKYMYALDLNNIRLRPMEGEDDKMHTPARPPEKYILYRAITWTGALTARQLNTSGVYAIL